MKLLVFRSLWGMNGSLEEQFARIARAGYDGVEGHPDASQKARFGRLLRRHKLTFVGMAFTGGPDHAGSLAAQIRHLKPLKPLSITTHSGRDAWTLPEGLAFFRAAARIEAELGVPVNHETHRGRFLFTPWNADAVLQASPATHLCADFSHWCTVTESLLEGVDRPVLDLAIARTRHIHARVGQAEAPQVSDPRAPEWRWALDRHLGWWKAMLKARQKAGARVATVTPEFGPPDYLPTLPYTRQPVADLWDVCAWMKDRLKQEFGRR